MKRLLLTSAAFILGASPAAFAQTAATAPAPAPYPAGSASVRQQITTTLQQSGFTDVKVMPDSFLVQAKDKSGNPMTVFVNPTSMTEVTAMNMSDGGKTGAMSGAGMFPNVPAKDSLSSKVVGLDVYNKANQDIGTIKDLAFDGTNVKAYIVGVGGFLGMGDHYVAVSPSAINVTWDAGAKKWHAAIDTDADQLKHAPEYKFPSNG